MGYFVGGDPGAFANVIHKPLRSVHVARKIPWLVRLILHNFEDQYPSGILVGRAAHYRSKMEWQVVGGAMIHFPLTPAYLARKA
jgi:hypothetical protein